MAKETKEELLENWYGWLKRRLSDHPAVKSNNKAYIKMALQGAIEQAIKEGQFTNKK